MRRVSQVVIFTFVMGWQAVQAGEAEVAAQLQQMQEQMKAMSQRIESQQKKIEEQDKTIAVLKGTPRSISNSPAADSLRNPEVTRKDNKSEPLPEGPPRRSWEMPAITVVGERDTDGAMREEDLIGKYKQPRWTARRRFTETRAYVIPEGNFELEYWSIIEVPRDGSDTKTETKYEAEIGLPNRLQLDIYAISHSEGNQKGFNFDEQDIELRWAFMDWGKLPGNPTAYAEYKWLDNEPDHYEFKMLFADETPIKGLHWAANGVFEHAMGGEQTNSYEATAAISYTLKDEKFSVGGELKVAFEDTKDNRGLHKPEILVGPSFQVSPLKQMHINFSPLIGLTEQSPTLKSLLIIGWEF
jgi:hypothetical protein